MYLPLNLHAINWTPPAPRPPRSGPAPSVSSREACPPLQVCRAAVFLGRARRKPSQSCGGFPPARAST